MAGGGVLGAFVAKPLAGIKFIGKMFTDSAAAKEADDEVKAYKVSRAYINDSKVAIDAGDTSASVTEAISKLAADATAEDKEKLTKKLEHLIHKDVITKFEKDFGIPDESKLAEGGKLAEDVTTKIAAKAKTALDGTNKDAITETLGMITKHLPAKARVIAGLAFAVVAGGLAYVFTGRSKPHDVPVEPA